MALSFLAVKGPESISTAVKVPYHTLFFRSLVRVTARGNIDRRVVEHCSFMYTSDRRSLLIAGDIHRNTHLDFLMVLLVFGPQPDSRLVLVVSEYGQ